MAVRPSAEHSITPSPIVGSGGDPEPGYRATDALVTSGYFSLPGSPSLSAAARSEADERLEAHALPIVLWPGIARARNPNFPNTTREPHAQGYWECQDCLLECTAYYIG